MVRVMVAFIIALIAGGLWGGDRNLYKVSLTDFKVDASLLNRIKEHGYRDFSGAGELYAFAEMVCNEQIIWRSSPFALERLGEVFDKKDSSNQAYLLLDQDAVVKMQVTVAQKRKDYSSVKWWAAAGGLLGGCVLTVATSGLALPAVAVSGGVVAGAGYGIAGGIVSAPKLENSVVLVSKSVSQQSILEKDVYEFETLGLERGIQLQLDVRKCKGLVSPGALEKDKVYVVAIPRIKLSSWNPDVAKSATYYLELYLDSDKAQTCPLGELRADTDAFFPFYVYVANKGRMRFRICRERRFLRDPVVMEGGKVTEDGKNWLFESSVTDGYGSEIEFESYSLELN